MRSAIGWVIVGEVIILLITLAVVRKSGHMLSMLINNTLMYVAGVLIAWRLL